MTEYCVVAVGYNRINSLMRLLSSLNNAEYGADEVDLIVSLDNAGLPEIVEMAKGFFWKHGNKKVIVQKERLGLKKHILKCGDYILQYRAGAILEDDIIVSPVFYEYMKQAVEHYENDDSIAGISLYTHLRHPIAGYPFIPAGSEYDTFFVQFAQSWGQIWLPKQWCSFKKWLETKDENIGHVKGFPDAVTNWSAKSWLKYHILYCYETNRYFVYPYDSLSTCCVDIGEHALQSENAFQVPLLLKQKERYLFADTENKRASVFYDVFFERKNISVPGTEGDVSFDIYGLKKQDEIENRFVVSIQVFDRKILSTYGLALRPPEVNAQMGMEGNQLYLYDMTIAGDNKQLKRNNVGEYIYFNKIHGQTRLLLKVAITKYIETAKLRLKKHFK
jgi:hypothetical protein